MSSFEMRSIRLALEGVLALKITFLTDESDDEDDETRMLMLKGTISSIIFK